MGLPAGPERDNVHRTSASSSGTLSCMTGTPVLSGIRRDVPGRWHRGRQDAVQPDANAFAESWIGNFKREVLNHFMCFGLKHLDHIAQQGAAFYNTHRPHQSKGNERLKFRTEGPRSGPSSNGAVVCQSILGGLLKHYHRKAA